MKLRTSCKTLLADQTSPISVYLRLRDRYRNCFLLESSEFHSADDCRSFICCDPLAEYRLEGTTCTVSYAGKSPTTSQITAPDGFSESLAAFLANVSVSEGTLPKGVVNGAFGYVGWNAVQMMENISFTNKADGITAIPDAQLFVFRYVLAFNHFRNEVHVLTNFDSATDASSSEDDDRTECFIREALSGSFQAHPFRAVGVESGSMTDPEFIKIIEKCKQHIARGDVFQIVPSRRYQQEYEGDDFQVYRALRSLNPSPYLFYCDFGGFRAFGSSPEAQIIVKDGEAAIHPVAGTCRRVGNDAVDRANADTLLHNEKENAEHAMLVDLARNDLSRHCKDVHVAHFREVQYFSHVIHLVSKVVGRIPPAVGAIKVMADSFPLGTLSGAPKHRAMQLLDQYEPTNRRTYGGSIGLFGFNGDAVLGIMIRSFFSTQRSLSYQVGMGIVHDSVPEQEVEEGNAKLGALRAAVRRASEL